MWNFKGSNMASREKKFRFTNGWKKVKWTLCKSDKIGSSAGISSSEFSACVNVNNLIDNNKKKSHRVKSSVRMYQENRLKAIITVDVDSSVYKIYRCFFKRTYKPQTTCEIHTVNTLR